MATPKTPDTPTPVVEATPTPVVDLPAALATFKEAVSASESPFKSHMLLKVEEMARYL